MKYAELHRLLRTMGCYELKLKGTAHPVWFSPLTGRRFTTSHHLSEEVKKGTLKNILQQAGIEQ